MADATSETKRKYSAPAAACAADVLLALTRAESALTVPQLAERTGTTKSLVYRVVAELEERRFVMKDPAGSYRLGLAVVELGGSFTASVPLMSSIRSILREIADTAGETVNLGVLQDDRVLYLAREEGEHSIVALSHVGKLLPATATGLGKALLAEMSDSDVRALIDARPLVRLTSKSIASVDALLEDLALVRRRRFAEEHEEAVLGRGCVAVSLSLPGQRAMLGMSISMSEESFDELRSTAVEALTRGREAITQHAASRAAIEPLGRLDVHLAGSLLTR